MTGVIIITHGDFGSYLLEAAEHIAGVKENVISISITSKMAIEEIRMRIKKATEEIRSKCDSIIYFVDLPGGTPMNSVLPLAKDIEKSAVICGVNMSMVVIALNYKDVMDFNRLVEKIIVDGKRAICDAKSILSNLDK